MIRLKDVSTMDFIIQHHKNSGDFSKEICELLDKYSITDYQKLEEFLNSNSSKIINWDIICFLRDELRQVKYYVDYANSHSTLPDTYKFNNYSLLEDKMDDFEFTDAKTNGDVLLLKNPLLNKNRKSGIEQFSIQQIKHMLAHVDNRNFKNCLLRAIGSNNLREMYNTITAVNHYNDQVLRQGLTTEESEVNLFTLNKKTKEKIIEQEIDYILLYLLENGNEFVWGSLSDHQKEQIFNMIRNYSEPLKGRIDKLIEVISNYTTLPELESGIFTLQEVPVVTDSAFKLELKKPIDRFIVK